jgi:molybdate transport system ATP-binding protein
VIEIALAVKRGSFSLEVALATGGVLAIVGPNAAGKSTLLAAILGVLPSTGTVSVGGRALHGLSTEARRLGYVPQQYALFPHLDVRGNVAFGARRDVDEVLRELELTGLARRRPATLSGGEQQRVALARALATQPDALLLDEPLAALDASTRQAMRRTLRTELQRRALPTILVTHDPADAEALADEVAVLDAGRVVQRGTPAALRAQPISSFVAELFSP